MRRGHRRRPMSEINVVPYIDVMLVLLVIFMITAPLLTQGVKIELPQASAEAVPPSEDVPLIVSVDAQGRFYLSIDAAESELVDERLLMNRTAAALRLKPRTQVLVKGDRDASYGEVVRVMALLQAAGAPSVGLLTDPSSETR